MSSGARYEGSYSNNERHGQGKYTDENNVTKVGIWENGEFKQWVSDETGAAA